MTHEVEILDLDALVRPIGKIKLAGKTHDILPVQGVAMQIVEQVAQQARRGTKANPTEQLDRGRRIVRAVVPTLTQEQVDRLNPEQLTAVINKATGPVDRVKGVIRESDAGKSGGSRKAGTKPRSTSSR